jgi:FkbM family methyltransferase
MKALDYTGYEITMFDESYMLERRTHACEKEPETVGWLEDTFGEGDVLYDIGANVGAYSLVAAAVASGVCKVYAFEPSPWTYQILCDHIYINKRTNIISPIPIALIDSTKIGRHRFASTEPGASADMSTVVYEDLTFDMFYMTLDDFVGLSKCAYPTHIKIDTDGCELDVLAGAYSTLCSSELRTILVETDNRNRESISNLLSTSGFEIASEHPRILNGVTNMIWNRSLSCQ